MTKGEAGARAVLIVGNNQLVKSFMVNLVEATGLLAIQASNADEALQVLASRSDVVLLVTNVAMPGSMNGVELTHAVADRWPSLKIIVASGQPGISEADLPTKSLLFTKPYHDDEMAFEIRSLTAS